MSSVRPQVEKNETRLQLLNSVSLSLFLPLNLQSTFTTYHRFEILRIHPSSTVLYATLPPFLHPKQPCLRLSSLKAFYLLSWTSSSPTPALTSSYSSILLHLPLPRHHASEERVRRVEDSLLWLLRLLLNSSSSELLLTSPLTIVRLLLLRLSELLLLLLLVLRLLSRRLRLELRLGLERERRSMAELLVRRGGHRLLLRDGGHSSKVLGSTDEGGSCRSVRGGSRGHGAASVLRLLEGGSLGGLLWLWLEGGWRGSELRLRLGLVEGLLRWLLRRR